MNKASGSDVRVALLSVFLTRASAQGSDNLAFRWSYEIAAAVDLSVAGLCPCVFKRFAR